MIRTDCASYIAVTNRCSALKKFYASRDDCGVCPFYKTAEKATKDREEAEALYFKHTGQTAEQYRAQLEGGADDKANA